MAPSTSTSYSSVNSGFSSRTVVFVGEAEVIVLVVAADGLAAEVAVEATFAVALVN